MAIRFYGDESENKEEKIHAIAGFIGFAGEWDRLHDEWIARVEPTGVSAYRMTDCDNGRGEFSDEKGWTRVERNRLTIDLIEIICRHDVFLLGMGVRLDDYRTLPPINDEGVMLGADKWHLVFQGVVQEAAVRVGEDAPPAESIAFFFDWKMKQGTANSIFDYTKQDLELKPWRNRLGTLTFGHKEFNVPGSIPLLQCADIAAVEVRKALAHPITRPDLPERKSLLRLKEADRVWSIKYLDKPVLDALYEYKREKLGLPNKAQEAAERLNRLRPDHKINNF